MMINLVSYSYIDLSCVGLSAMIQGAHDGNSFVVKCYKETEIEQILQDYFTS